MDEIETIKINEVEYVRKDQINKPAVIDGLKYVIVRAYYAGVHAGYLVSQKDKEIVLKNARRIWYWDGAASLSQMCMEGVSKPENCKFSMPVNEVKILDACEILDCTEKARKNIEGVIVWRR